MQTGLKHKINAWVKRFDKRHSNDKKASPKMVMKDWRLNI